MPTMGNNTLAGGMDVFGAAIMASFLGRRTGLDFFLMITLINPNKTHVKPPQWTRLSIHLASADGCRVHAQAAARALPILPPIVGR